MAKVLTFLTHRLRSVYRNLLLPAVRSLATPCFRVAVKVAGWLGILPHAAAPGANEPERFLIVHLSHHVGDTVMLLPMIEALRREHPTSRVECVVEVPMDSLLRLIPSIDRVYSVHMGQGPTATLWMELQRTFTLVGFYWRTMRHVGATTCIIPRWGCGFRDLMLAYLMQAPRRVGFASNDFDRSQPPSGYRDALLTCLVRGAQGMSDPARFLYLLEQAGILPGMDFAGRVALAARPSDSMRQVAASVDWAMLAERLGLDPEARLAVIAPGATHAKKIWPVDRWAAVVEDLHLREFTVVLLSGSQDAAIARELYAGTPAGRRGQTALVAGATSLAESACLLGQASIFAGNDSGPGHLAGALGVPCVILFIAAEGADPDAPFAPERVRPMGERVVCCRPTRTIAPCTVFCRADCAHCILEIQSGEVTQAIGSLLHSADRAFVSAVG